MSIFSKLSSYCVVTPMNLGDIGCTRVFHTYIHTYILHVGITGVICQKRGYALEEGTYTRCYCSLPTPSMYHGGGGV